MEYETGPRLLDDATRDAIVSELSRGWKYPLPSDRESRILHIAYLLHGDQAFSKSDVIAILLGLPTDTSDTTRVLERCCKEGWLVMVAAGEHPHYKLSHGQRAEFDKRQTFSPLP